MHCVLSILRVAAHSNKNLMAASNLGVVFGPTLMKSREESMAAIMNLKYQSVVIELLIKEFDAVSSEIFNVLFYLKMVTPRSIPFLKLLELQNNYCVSICY